MKRLAAVALAALLAASSACHKSKPADTSSKPKPCAADSDCAQGWVCLAHACADPRASAVYTHPSNAVTPEKVKQQVEQVGAEHEADIDKRLETNK